MCFDKMNTSHLILFILMQATAARQAVDYACYSHLRTATTAPRGFITPFEAINNKATMWSDTYKAVTDEVRGTVVHSRHITFNRDSFDYSDIGGPLSHSSMAQSELLELVDIPQFHKSEEASEVIPDSQNGSGANSQNDSQAEDISQQSGSSQDALSHPSPNPQNIAPPHEIIDQPHPPNDVDSPNSSFHFPANVPNESQQGIAQQQHPPIAPVSPPSQNISASNESDVQQENNPTFDGARRSTRVRAQAPHPDAE